MNFKSKTEWWITSSGKMWRVRTSHNDDAADYLINEMCQVLGVSNEFQSFTDFRVMVGDEMDANGDYDWWERMLEEFTAKYDEATSQAISKVVGGSNLMDPRDFAVNYWNWIRVADGGDKSVFHVKALDRSRLKRLHDIIPRILKMDKKVVDFDELVVTVHADNHNKFIEYRYDELKTGKYVSGDDFSSNLSKQVHQMDQKLTPSFYKGNLSEAAKRKLRRLAEFVNRRRPRSLTESLTQDWNDDCKFIGSELLSYEIVERLDDITPGGVQWKTDNKGGFLIKLRGLTNAQFVESGVGETILRMMEDMGWAMEVSQTEDAAEGSSTLIYLYGLIPQEWDDDEDDWDTAV